MALVIPEVTSDTKARAGPKIRSQPRQRTCLWSRCKHWTKPDTVVFVESRATVVRRSRVTPNDRMVVWVPYEPPTAPWMSEHLSHA